jgi:hypothetical protein
MKLSRWVKAEAYSRLGIVCADIWKALYHRWPDEAEWFWDVSQRLWSRYIDLLDQEAGKALK